MLHDYALYKLMMIYIDINTQDKDQDFFLSRIHLVTKSLISVGLRRW